MMRWTKITKGALRWGILVFLGLVLIACDGGERARQRQEALDTLTRRQKDELISNMPIPGAGAVGKALSVTDSVKARAERIDSTTGG